MSRIPKIICIAISIIFLTFSLIQYNDPDYILWMGVYGIAAALSLAVAFDKVSRSVLVAAMIAYLVGAAAIWPTEYEGLSDYAQASVLREQMGEAAGLFICFLATVYFLIIVGKKRSRKKK